MKQKKAVKGKALLSGRKEQIFRAVEQGQSLRRIHASIGIEVSYDQLTRYMRDVGRVEFYSRVEDIRGFLLRGWPAKSIYDHLWDAGLIHCTRGQFASFVEEMKLAEMSEPPPKLSAVIEEPKTTWVRTEKQQERPAQPTTSKKAETPKEKPATTSQAVDAPKAPKQSGRPVPGAKGDSYHGWPFEVTDQTGKTEILMAFDPEGWVHYLIDPITDGVYEEMRPYPQRKEDLPVRQKPEYAPGQWNPHPSRDWAPGS